MKVIFELIIFYTICSVGWCFFKWLRVPSPAVLGAIIAMCIANMCGLPIEAPSWFQSFLMIATGVIIGMRLNVNFKGMWHPALLMVGWILCLTFVTERVPMILGLSEATALFSSTPGGLSEMALVALTFDADAFVVSLLQSSRLIAAVLTIPFIVRRLPPNKNQIQTEQNTTGSRKATSLDWVLIPIIAIIAALLFNKLGAPAAFLLGPLVAVGLYAKKTGIRVHINELTQQIQQLSIGGLVGLGITRESMMHITEYILPLACYLILIIGGSMLLAVVMRKITGWDITTCLLSTSPGGMVPAIILAMDLGGDPSKVAIFQVLRLTTALILAPLSAWFLLGG